MSEESWNAVDRYFTDKFLPSDHLLEAVLECSREAGLPAIEVTPTQGRFLNLLARLQRARTVLEIGTLGGYSAIWLGRALPPNGVLLTLENDPECARVAKINFERAGMGDLIALREGPALDSLHAMIAEERGPFDFIFIDANKDQNTEYLEAALHLSRPGTLIVADNVVRGGEVANPESTDPHILGLRHMCDLIDGDPRLEATALQTVGSKGHDGFAIAIVQDVP